MMTKWFEKGREKHVSAEVVEFRGFHEALKKTIDEYDGQYKDLVKHCPRLFELLCRMLNDKTTDWNTKLMIDAALAYFVLPDDLIPDYEEAGYVDDLFIVCHVLKGIKERGSVELLQSNWKGEEDILRLIDFLHEQSSRIVGSQSLEILRKVGLQKYQSLDLEEHSGSYPQKLVRLANEKRELLGLVAYLVKIMYRVNMRNSKIEHIKEFLEQHEDYDEVNRLIELSKRTQPSLSQPEKRTLNKNGGSQLNIEDMESQLRAARLAALVKENVEKED